MPLTAAAAQLHCLRAPVAAQSKGNFAEHLAEMFSDIFSLYISLNILLSIIAVLAVPIAPRDAPIQHALHACKCSR